MASNLPLTASEVSKSYARDTVVDNVSLTLKPGEITALIGGSGAGKSTLLRLFAGFERVDAGEIRRGDALLSSKHQLTAPKDRKIGLIFQDFALFPHLNILDNIMFGLNALERPDRVRVAEEWVSRMRLERRRDAYPHQLSGGEQQRVAIARALAPEPLAILMDEPFSGLDPSLRASTREMALAAVRDANIPALLVTHDPDEALAHADHIAVMAGGKLLQYGPTNQVYFDPLSYQVAQALGPVVEHSLQSLPSEWQESFEGHDKVYWRPEALQIDAQGSIEARVTGVSGVGSAAAIHVEAGGFKCRIRSSGPLPKTGETVRLTLDRHAVFTFPPHKT